MMFDDDEDKTQCYLCDAYCKDSEVVTTECGESVGECCVRDLHVTGYETEHDSETFYHLP
jgi:hypothetical protein